ncbi:hypothetical protein GCM10010174_61870 [Kutzneria viridogrisea]|uniref:Uncharacterized protein n=1 Tax=Kutzneria viridogrisea TaxID=47990 RepID=A0ABR6BH44_9PSEU|nr:hypothetical protein [Kutzneria viridogrisea]
MPLTVQAELRARLTGRGSFALLAGRLVHRDRDRIRGDVRGRPPVFASHRCGVLPAADDVEPRHVRAVTEYLSRLHAATHADEDPVLWHIVTSLGGRVIGLTDTQTPPY